MRIYFFILSLILFVQTLFAYDYTITKVSGVVDNINQFRANPISYISSLGLESSELQDIAEKWDVSYLSSISYPAFQVDPILEELAESHLKFILSKGSIEYFDAAFEAPYGYIFGGETLIGMAFQNYLDIYDVQQIISDYLVSKVLLLNDYEAAPILFPYDKVGAAILTLNLKIENSNYNFYLVDILFGKLLDSDGGIYGKILSKSRVKKVYLYKDSLFIKSFNVYPDGSFAIGSLENGVYDMNILFDNGTVVQRHPHLSKDRGNYIDVD